MIKTRRFGALVDGRTVNAHVFSNANGMTATVIDWGGIITSLCVPDRNGVPGDVVLGFDTLPPYLGTHPYFGAITGRIAGRVAGGRLNIDGVVTQLDLNDGVNHLHGGITGLDKRLWGSTVQGDTLVLRYHSPDGEEGYPGNLDITVRYTLDDQNRFIIDSEATSDRATPLSLTNHSYFNLAGAGTIEDHVLEVFADFAFERDDTLATTGAVFPVDGTPGDLRKPRRLGDVIPEFLKQHGDLYRIPRGGGDVVVPIARVTDPASGRVLEVGSTQTCMQLYTSAHFDGSLTGKGGAAYPRFGGLCLECEGYPGVTDDPACGDILVRPGRIQKHRTVFSFSTN